VGGKGESTMFWDHESLENPKEKGKARGSKRKRGGVVDKKREKKYSVKVNQRKERDKGKGKRPQLQ